MTLKYRFFSDDGKGVQLLDDLDRPVVRLTSVESRDGMINTVAVVDKAIADEILAGQRLLAAVRGAR